MFQERKRAFWSEIDRFVYKRFLKWGYDRDSALDGTQDTLIEVLRSLGTLEPDSTPDQIKGWVYVIAKRVRANQIEKSVRRLGKQPAGEHELGWQPGRSIGADWRANFDELMDSLKQIDERDRTILEMAIVDERSMRDIASALEMTETNVKKRLHVLRTVVLPNAHDTFREARNYRGWADARSQLHAASALAAIVMLTACTLPDRFSIGFGRAQWAKIGAVGLGTALMLALQSPAPFESERLSTVAATDHENSSEEAKDGAAGPRVGSTDENQRIAFQQAASEDPNTDSSIPANDAELDPTAPRREIEQIGGPSRDTPIATPNSASPFCNQLETILGGASGGFRALRTGTSVYQGMDGRRVEAVQGDNVSPKVGTLVWERVDALDGFSCEVAAGQHTFNKGWQLQCKSKPEVDVNTVDDTYEGTRAGIVSCLSGKSVVKRRPVGVAYPDYELTEWLALQVGADTAFINTTLMEGPLDYYYVHLVIGVDGELPQTTRTKDAQP